MNIKTKEEQLVAINSIMSKGMKFPKYNMSFGKYKGNSLQSVYENDKQYLVWVYNEIDELPKVLEKFIEQRVLK